MLLYQRFIPGLAINSYVVGDERTGEAAVIDPTRDVAELIRYAAENGLRIGHILETHVHADFVCGSRELKARLGGEPVIHASGCGGDEWTPAYADHILRDGDTVKLGGVRLNCLHMPGHTPEHVAFSLTDTARSGEVPWLLFTGDFLFVGDVGRPDLLGEEARQRLADDLYRSAFERLSGLPDFTEIFPNHGAGSLCGKAMSARRSSTIGYERRFNPSLAAKPREQWVRDLLAGMPLAPPYFRRMKKVNKEGPPVLGTELPGQRRYIAKEVHDLAPDECLVVDVRAKESFAAAHVPNSLSLPLSPTLASWAGWVMPYDRPFLLVADDPGRAAEAVTHFLRIGLDDVRGYLDGGIDAWAMAGYPLTKLTTISVHDLAAEIRGGSKATVLDVRTDGEWNAGHIDGAQHIHAGTLPGRIGEVPRDRPVTIICGSGYRASIAGSILRQEGFGDVTNVIGGMMAWKAAGLPTAGK